MSSTDDVSTPAEALRQIGTEEPPALELAEYLAAETDGDVVTAQDEIYAAIENGRLVETGEGFGGLRLAAEETETDVEEPGAEPPAEKPPAPPEQPPEEPASVDSEGRGETVETAEVDPQELAETASRDGDTAAAVEALDDAIDWFHAQIEESIDDHTETGDHADRPATAAEWFRENRGFNAETIEAKRLGWSPPNAGGALVTYLYDHGHSRDAILSTGLFTDDLRLLWNGRYVFPYHDTDGKAVYAISRCTGSKGGGKVGYDGHPTDFIHGKYGKLAHTKEYVEVSEPIFGLGSLSNSGPVLITEGVADAIRAHEYGYACLSPVTTQFKHEHREALLEILSDASREAYVIQDSERPKAEHNEEEEGWDALGLTVLGEGMKGALRTAAYLSEHDLAAEIATLPRHGLEKVDLDDYLNVWADTLRPVLASAKPAREHPAFEEVTGGATAADGEAAETESSPLSGSSSSDASGDYPSLGKEEVEEALSHVSSTLSYDEWIKLAYAVCDWDDTDRGKKVFLNWSQKSGKWDENEGKRSLEWVWSNADAGTDADSHTTVGTLIQRAKNGGWQPSFKGRTRSDYLEAHLAEYSEEAEPDPYTDHEAQLRACLRARAAGEVAAETEPPTLALMALMEHVMGYEPRRGMSDATRELLVEAYHDIEEADLNDLLD